MTAQGRRTDGNTDCTLLVIHETDSSWAIHGPGTPGVRLSRSDVDAVAILAGAR